MRRIAQHPGARRRAAGRLFGLGAAALLTASFVAGCSGPATPDGGDGEPSPTVSEQPRPTPSSVTGPEPVGTIVPAECEDLYSPGMFEALQEDLPPLNDPTMQDPNFSNNDEIEKLLRGLEYLQCTWSGAGDLGIVTAVAKLTEQQAADARGIMESDGYDCYEQLSGIRCVTREEADGSAIGESHFFRDDVWLSTFWANAPIRGYTENMIGAIWG